MYTEEGPALSSVLEAEETWQEKAEEEKAEEEKPEEEAKEVEEGSNQHRCTFRWIWKCFRSYKLAFSAISRL